MVRLLHKLLNLNTLDLSDCSTLTTLPNTIGELTNLNTLSLGSCSNLTQLPDTICNLKNLHTLNLEGCSALTTLPNNIGKLNNLHTLDLWNCTKLTTLPQTMTQLTHLNTLTVPASLATSNHEVFQHLKLKDLTLHCMGTIKKQDLENLLNTQSNLPSLCLYNDNTQPNISPFVELLSSKQFARLELRNWIISGREQLKQLLGGLKKPEGSTELPSLTINRIDLRFTVPDEEMNNLKELRLGF